MLLLLTVMTLALTGCGHKDVSNLSDEAKFLCGSWAYIHEPDKTALKLNDDLTAKLDGEKYTYEVKDSHIELTDKSGNTVSYRYLWDEHENQLFFFKQNVYTYKGTGTPDGIVGLWECPEQNYKFEFTSEGTFQEDGYFPGYYVVDEEAGSFKLIYNDQFYDTTCYFTLNGNELLIEYPWPMVRVK